MNILTQNQLPFKYLCEKNEKTLTGLSGLLLYLELFKAIGLDHVIRQNLTIKKERGWRDDQIVLALILLNLAGGESVSDIEYLERDRGFCQIMSAMELRGTMGRQREKIRKRWRRQVDNTFAHPSSIFRYLIHFVNGPEEKKRRAGVSVIPEPNEHLKRFPVINSELMDFVQRVHPVKRATMDQDATLSNTHKSSAFFCYKGPRAFQPFNVWWDEQGVMLHTEFRDGNVYAGFDQLRVFKESLESLPQGVEEVYARSDSAGYQWDLIRYFGEGQNERFGVIPFSISADITKALKESILNDGDLEWSPIYRDLGNGIKRKSSQEWAEIDYVPSELCYNNKSPNYRYLVVREKLQQQVLPGMEDQMKLPFPTLTIDTTRYKISAVITNLDWDGERVIHWHRQRCGRSEEVHHVLKEELAGGRFPSNQFGANAAWWWIAVLSFNLHSIMKQFVLDKTLKKSRVKAIRYRIMRIPARMVKRDGIWNVWIPKDHPAFNMLISARERIWELACLPSG